MIEKNQDLKRKQGTGSKSKIFDKINEKKLRKMFDGKDNISSRKAARKFKCDHSTIIRRLKKLQIKCRKKTNSPGYTENQIKIIKS
jgi:DNA invertase Pin-like site-specific DNA recombinase